MDQIITYTYVYMYMQHTLFALTELICGFSLIGGLLDRIRERERE